MSQTARQIVMLAVVMLPGLMPARAGADAIIVTQAMKASTIAEVFIDDTGIRVEIEVGMPDLEAFGNILPDEVYEKVTGRKQPLATG